VETPQAMATDAACAVARTGTQTAVGSRHCIPLPHTEGLEARTATDRETTKCPVEGITHGRNFRLMGGVYRCRPTPVNVLLAQGPRTRELEGATRGPMPTVRHLDWGAHPRLVLRYDAYFDIDSAGPLRYRARINLSRPWPRRGSIDSINRPSHTSGHPAWGDEQISQLIQYGLRGRAFPILFSTKTVWHEEGSPWLRLRSPASLPMPPWAAAAACGGIFVCRTGDELDGSGVSRFVHVIQGTYACNVG
jgi:hypothetical protein